MKKCAKKSQVQWYTKTKSWSRAVEWNFATGYRDFSHFSGQVSRKTNVITFCGLAGSSTWLVAVAGTTLAALSLASKVMTQAATIRKPGRRNKQKLNLSKTLLRIWITLPMHHQLKKRQCKKMSNTSSYSLFHVLVVFDLPYVSRKDHHRLSQGTKYVLSVLPDVAMGKKERWSGIEKKVSSVSMYWLQSNVKPVFISLGRCSYLYLVNKRLYSDLFHNLQNCVLWVLLSVHGIRCT